MKTVYKYPLQITDEQLVRMPDGAEILSVQMQKNTMCLWALVSPESHVQRGRYIAIVGTGNPMPEAQTKFIGTIQMSGGSLVWHVFEIL